MLHHFGRVGFVFWAIGLSMSLAASVAADTSEWMVLDLDTSSYRLTARDGPSAAAGPDFSVALGSPASSTPLGSYRLYRVILNPSWMPGEVAVRAGAERADASLETPMGVAKIPFAQNGSIALHGGGDPRAVGKPISSGCVRATDADILRLIAWLDLRGALGAPEPQPNGEILRAIVRPVVLRLR